MYLDIELTPEEEEKMIRNIAKKIHEYKIDFAAVLMIESVKPMSYVGSQMGRFFISPFLPSLGENIGIGGEKLFQVLEKRDNVDKLINAIKKLTKEEEEQKKVEKVKKLAEKRAEIETEGASNKKGLRRFLPF